jgi:phosphoenolpyruvate carboxykinase (ATP)
MADMGNRMLELLDSHEMKVFVLNTGRVGGGDEHEGSKKLTIPASSAIVQAIVEGTISWTTDPDFGYEIAGSVPGSGTSNSSSLAGSMSGRTGWTSTRRWWPG